MASLAYISQNRIFWSALNPYRVTLVIDLVCAKCGAVYHSDLSHVGKWIQCPRCGELVPILEAGAVSTLKQTSAVSQTVIQPKTPIPKRRSFSRPVLLATVLVLIFGVLAWLYLDHVATNQSSVEPVLAEEHPQVSSPSLEKSNPGSSPRFEIVDGDAIDLRSMPSKAEQSRTIVPRPSSYRSLATGSPTCGGSEYGGRGVLKVENGTNEDADVRLFDLNTNQLIRCFFVRKGDSVQVEEIPERTCLLRYSSGLDWDDRERVFRWNPSYSQFEKRFIYSEVEVGNAVEYHEIRVTLHTVVGGNVRTQRISREQFLRTDHQASGP